MNHGLTANFGRTLFFLGVTATALLLHTKPLTAQTTPFLITPYFGTQVITQNYSPSHPALDFGMSYEPVLATASGVVDNVSWFNDNCHQYWHQDGDHVNCGYGLYTRVRYGNGYRSIYAHLSAAAFNLGTTNAYVSQGQILGTSGHTGYSSGPHLHFQTQQQINGIWTNINPSNVNNLLWKDGQWANPSRPIPLPPTNGEIIVDDNNNNSGGFSKGRNAPFNTPCPPNSCPYWYAVSAGYGNDMYYTFVNGNIADYWARWQPPGIPDGGSIYEIFVHVPNVNATTWQAQYTVVHGLGQSTAVVDQYGLNNRWVSIGAYNLRPGDYVYTTDATGEGPGDHCGAGQWCRLGVDAVKFVRLGTTYVPAVRGESGWSTQVTIRSNGGDALTTFWYYGNSGERLCGGTYGAILAHTSLTLPPCSDAAAVVIDSTQNVAVATLMTRASPFASAAYSGVAEPTTEVLTPLAHRHNYGWNSFIHIHNARPTINGGVISFRAAAAGNDCQYSFILSPRQTWVIDTSSSAFNCLGSPFVGSAQVTASQPLAVAYIQYSSNYSSLIASQGTVNASGNFFAPLIQNNHYNYYSGFSLQNGAGSNANLSATYYLPNGNALCPASYTNVLAYRTVIQNPAPPAGCTSAQVLSARFSSSAGLLAAQVNQFVSGTPQWSGYPAIRQPTNRSAVPRVYGNWDGWITGLQVQNAGGAAANVTVNFYNSAGAQYSSQSGVIQPNASMTFVTPGSSIIGSAMVIANQPVTVVVNHLRSGSGDVIMSHVGVNH